MAESVIFHCKGCKIWPTDIQSIQKWKWNSINHFMTIFILIICYWVTYQPKFSSLRQESFCEVSVVQGLGRALVGSFLVGGSGLLFVGPSWSRCLTAWRPRGRQGAYRMAEGIDSKYSVSKLEAASPFLSWPWVPHCLVLLVRGESQTHQDIWRGHWTPSFESGVARFWKNTWDRRYCHGHLWKKQSAMIYHLATTIHISLMCKSVL